MKALLVADTLMRYPDHNLPFHIFTDASDYQLGSVIMQNDLPVAYYSRKLSAAQKNYTTIEKELLSVVETFKEFRSMLLGAVLHVHTDHRNLIYNTLHTQRLLRWRLYIEEYHPTFHYVKGTDNAIADSISRLPRLESLVEDDIDIGPKSPKSTSTSTFSIELDDEPLLTCFLNHPSHLDRQYSISSGLLFNT